MADKQDVKELLEGQLVEFQRELRKVQELKTSEQWKYVLSCLQEEVSAAATLATIAPSDFMYLRSSLARDALKEFATVLDRREKRLAFEIQQKKIENQQYL